MPNPRTLRPGGKFTPKSVKGLALWLDASDAEGLCTTADGPIQNVSDPLEILQTYVDTSLIAGWWKADAPARYNDQPDNGEAIVRDASGNVLTWGTTDIQDYCSADQGTAAARPLYVPNAYNGKPCIRFNGSHALTGAFSINLSSATRQYFIVVKISGSTNFQRVFSVASSSGSDLTAGQVIPCLTNSTSTSQLCTYDATNGATSPVPGFDTLGVFSSKSSGSPASLQCRGNGCSGTTASYSITQNGDIFGIGCAANQTAKFTGDICEIIALNVVLPAWETAAIERYLSLKWGISTVHDKASSLTAAISSPLALSGCALWLDAMDFASTANGASISQWSDKSGNGRHASQATSTAQPTLQLTGANGKPTLLFDTGDWLTSTATIADVVGSATTLPTTSVSLVCFMPALVSSGQIAFGSSNTANGRFYFNSHFGGASTIFDTVNATTGRLLVTALSESNYLVPHILTAYRNGPVMQVRLNGTPYISRTDASGAYTTTSSTFQIGKVDGGSGYQCYISEMVAYSAAQTLTDVSRVEKYLAEKWGIANVAAPSPPVGYWRDRSGNNRHATQSTAANRPAVSSSTQNTKTQVALTSAQGNCLSTADLSLSAPYSLLAVVSSASRRIGTFAGSGNATNTQYGDGSVTYSGAYYGASRVGGTVYGSAPIATGRAQVVSAVAASGTLPLSLSMWSDGIGGVAGSAFPSATVPSNALGGPLQVGATQTSSWGGTVCEMLAYSKALSASERKKLERYLAAKWGITLAPQVSNADAQDWIDRVYANGATVLPATAAAVNQFCVDIEQAGLRTLMYRANLFAGTGLNAALVPLYRNWKVYGRRNLNIYGEPGGSGWTSSSCTTTTSSSERPFDGPYAKIATATAGTGLTPYIVTTANNLGYGTITVSAYLKANGQNTVRLLLVGSSGMTFPGGGSVAYANIDLSTGAISNVLAGTTATATSVGNGWWRLAYTVANNSAGNMSVRFDIGGGAAYNTTGSESIFVWGVQSELGSTATNYDPYPLGNATDTNVGPFVTGDYAETGVGGGLVGNGTSKYLNTGFPGNSLAVGNRHLSAYEVVRDTTQYRSLIGTQDNGGGTYFFALTNTSPGTTMSFHCGNQADVASQATGAHWIGSDRAANAMSLYKNGAEVGFSNGTSKVLPSVQPILVFAVNQLAGSVSPAGYSASRLGGYSIGLALSGAQAADYNAAMQKFQTALTRNV